MSTTTEIATDAVIGAPEMMKIEISDASMMTIVTISTTSTTETNEKGIGIEIDHGQLRLEGDFKTPDSTIVCIQE